MSIYAKRIIEQSEKLYKKQRDFTKKILVLNAAMLLASFSLFLYYCVR